MKVVIAIALIVVLAALAFAGVSMLKNRKGQRHMARALTVRIGVSVALFLFILLSYHEGWIRPTGIQMQSR